MQVEKMAVDFFLIRQISHSESNEGHVVYSYYLGTLLLMGGCSFASLFDQSGYEWYHSGSLSLLVHQRNRVVDHCNFYCVLSHRLPHR